jgi:CDP-diacylglycerol--glycerol-3-phosphate 3-phosphatidyltransferase
MNSAAHARFPLLRQLPNAITAARLCTVPVLVALAWQRRESAFAWLLVASLVSDILDGLIARLLHASSPLGALLDSVADAALFFVAAYGLFVFHPGVVAQHGWAFGAVVAVWVLEQLWALARYRRLSSFHTYLSKAAGYALGIFIGVTFLFGFSPWLMGLAVAVALTAGLEEFALLALLPEWRSDVRGLWWVLREPRRSYP